MTESERVLPLFPLEQVVLFPGMSLPLHIFEERYKVMIGACQVTDQLFGVVLIRSGSEVGEPAQTERIGCTARMLRIDRLPDGRMTILTIGVQRFRLQGPARVMPEGYLVADVRMLSDQPATLVGADLVSSLATEFGKYRTAALSFQQPRSGQTIKPPELPADPLRLSYQIAATLHIHPRERQRLLELDDVAERLKHELTLLRRENRPAAGTIGPFSIN
ncbi:MAG: LON peptidase substrate-binding domain-containing protein [Chloroflexi bacterium]|nr:LON peptidase substrate-binding domain-containing protein [Chloroflexota bacterium]